MWILKSYRWRRRLIFAAIVVTVATPLIILGVHYSSPGNPGNANGPTVPDYVQPTKAAFTAEKKREVRAVLKKFIGTAVVRHNVAAAWDIAGPSLKQDVSRKEWNRGDIPVVPYPAAKKGWGNWSYVQYSYTNAVGLEVFLFPKPGSGWSAMTADVEVVKGKNGRWLVDYWMPTKFHGPAATAPADSSSTLKEGPPNVHKLPGKKQAAKLKQQHEAKQKARSSPRAAAAQQPQNGPLLSGIWWALPIGLLSLIVLLPIMIGLLVWHRTRKAEREFQRSRG
jgi:hypothetical protein